MDANNCTNPPHFPPHCGCPANSVNTDFTGRVVLVDQTRIDEPVGCDLAYTPDDPFTVKLTLQAEGQSPVEWALGRDFLAEGHVSLVEHGDGDVRMIWLKEKQRIAVCLKNPTGHAHLVLPHGPVADFVQAVDERYPADKVDADGLIDSLIAEIFSE